MNINSLASKIKKPAIGLAASGILATSGCFGTDRAEIFSGTLGNDTFKVYTIDHAFIAHVPKKNLEVQIMSDGKIKEIILDYRSNGKIGDSADEITIFSEFGKLTYTKSLSDYYVRLNGKKFRPEDFGLDKEDFNIEQKFVDANSKYQEIRELMKLNFVEQIEGK